MTEAVLPTFCCYDHCAKASEEVQKIATNKKVSQMLLVCYNLNSQNIATYQSVTVKNDWLQEYL